MTTLSIPQGARAPLQIRQYLRNGALPDAELMARLATDANFAARWCTQEVTRFAHAVTAIPSGGLTNGWKAQWHSSPWSARLVVRLLCALQDHPSSQPYALCTVRDTAGNVIGTARVDWGYSSGGALDVPSEWMAATLPIRNTAGTIVAMPADTDLRLDITSGGTRLISASVHQLALVPDTSNGYAAQAFAALSPIREGDRGDVATVAREVWKHAGAKLWSYGANSLLAYASGTPRNVISRNTTVVTAGTPGAVLDLTERSSKRLASSGVPVVLAVYASATTATGHVTLKDSTGTVLITVNVSAGAAAWYTATGFLPATVAKYDLHEAPGASGTITVHGATLYQYLT